MRLWVILALLLAGCSSHPPPPQPAAVVVPPAVTTQQQAESILTTHGYTNPLLSPVPGGWAGTASHNGQEIGVTVDTHGYIITQ